MWLVTQGGLMADEKRGRLVPAGDEDEHPWLALRGKGRWTGDPYKPVVDEDDVQVLKRPAGRV